MDESTETPSSAINAFNIANSPSEVMKPAGEVAGLSSAQVESLLSSIQEQAQACLSKVSEIEQERLRIEKTRVEAESQLITLQEAVAHLKEHLATVTSLASEATNSNTNIKKNEEEVLGIKTEAMGSLTTIQTSLTTASEGIKRIEALRSDAEQKQAVISEKSVHIEDARVHADSVRASIDKLFTQVQLIATNTDGQYQASKAILDNLNTLHTSAQTIKANTESDAASIAKLRQQSEDHMTTTQRLANIADTVNDKIRAYESELDSLTQAAAERLKTIEGLLPGATSAGLASAFSVRRTYFKWPQIIWQLVFVTSILALVGLAGWEFYVQAGAESALTLDKLWILLLHRLPFALPLIWLAFHASHRAALAQRLEEDYGFKETISRVFEGFRREMTDLEGKAAPHSALALLCNHVLGIVTNPPGRIYEKHRLNHTPLTALADSAGPIADAASKVVVPKIGG